MIHSRQHSYTSGVKLYLPLCVFQATLTLDITYIEPAEDGGKGGGDGGGDGKCLKGAQVLCSNMGASSPKGQEHTSSIQQNLCNNYIHEQNSGNIQEEATDIRLLRQKVHVCLGPWSLLTIYVICISQIVTLKYKIVTIIIACVILGGGKALDPTSVDTSIEELA